MLLCEKFQYLFEKETHEPEHLRKQSYLGHCAYHTSFES